MNSLINKLNNKEIEIIASLAAIETKAYSVNKLFEMFQIESYEHLDFFETIHDLSKKEVLGNSKDTYYLNIDYKNIIFNSNLVNTENCSVLINYFYNKLKNTKLPFGDDIKNATKQSELLLESIEDESIALANLSIRVYLKHNLSKNYQTALKYNKKAIQILKSIDKLHPRLALCYRDSSFIYSKLGENQTALKYNKKDIHILEAYSGKYNYLLGDSYFAISRTYDELGDFSKAIEYGKKAIQIEKSYSKNKSKLKRLSALYNNLSHYYYMDNDIKNASIYINKAVNLIKKNKFDSNFDLKYILRNQKYFNSLYKLIVVFEKYKYFILGSALILTIALIYFIVSLFL